MARKHVSIVLSREQALQGASVAGANARGLLAFAAAGAKTENYGPAVALCVLASEEGAKALSLLLEAVSPSPTGLSLADVLSRHKTKHDISQVMSAVVYLMRLVRHIKTEVQSEIDSGAVHLEQAGSQYVARVVQQLKMTAESSEERDFITWYQRANALKEQGFYVDWDGDWKIPSSATREDYELYHSYVEWWLDLVDEVLAVPPAEWESGFKQFEHIIAANGNR